MNLTPEQQARTQLLSDEALYKEACKFIRDHAEKQSLPDARQFMGLLQFSRTWKELQEYINHQSERDWGSNQTCPEFYNALCGRLRELQARYVEPLVSKTLSKKERQAAMDCWADALMPAFIQHLYAEGRYHVALKEQNRAQRRNHV